MMIMMLLAVATQTGQLQVPEGASEKIAAECVAPADYDRPMDSFTPDEREAMIACAMRRSAALLNAQMPHRVDEITTLESVDAAGTMVIYNNRVDIDAGAVRAEHRAALEQATRQHVCQQADMVQTISFGGSYRYIWRDTRGALVHDLIVNRC